MSSGKHALSLYKSLLRECTKLNSYNFRMYALEKVKYEFRENKLVTDQKVVSQLLQKAQDNLDIVKRQALIGHMYGEGHLVIENEEYLKQQR